MLTVRREQFRYMKNKYLTRFLCLTLMSGMALSGPASVLAAEDALCRPIAGCSGNP